jgi:hypothetical protein
MELPAEIIEELAGGAKAAPPTANSDKRMSPRLLTDLPVTIVRLTGKKDGKPMHAVVRDLSARGIGIEFSEPIHVNDLFAVRLHRRDGTPLWLQCMCVRWSPIDGKQYAIGAKFTGTFLPANKGGDPEPTPH